MRFEKKNIIGLMVFLSLTNLFGQSLTLETEDFLARTYIHEGTDLNYRILYPNNFDKNNKYPLFLFLHGAGERGDDNKKQLIHGSKLFKDKIDQYPAIVVIPQCPSNDYWANVNREETPNGLKFEFFDDRPYNPSLKAVVSLIDSLLAEKFIDDKRFYISGLSMGGMGVWELLRKIPDKIAAAAPICGGGSPKAASKMINIPIWALHGIKDTTVPFRHSVAMVLAVQGKGGKAKITLYPNANHNSWDPTFDDPDYLKWFFEKKRD